MLLKNGKRFVADVLSHLMSHVFNIIIQKTKVPDKLPTNISAYSLKAWHNSTFFSKYINIIINSSYILNGKENVNYA